MSTRNQGIAQLPVLLGLALMAVALPIVSLLASRNQDNRNRAAYECSETTRPKTSCPIALQAYVCNSATGLWECKASTATAVPLLPTSTKVPTTIPPKVSTISISTPTPSCYCEASSGRWTGTCGSTILGQLCRDITAFPISPKPTIKLRPTTAACLINGCSQLGINTACSSGQIKTCEKSSYLPCLKWGSCHTFLTPTPTKIYCPTDNKKACNSPCINFACAKGVKCLPPGTTLEQVPGCRCQDNSSMDTCDNAKCVWFDCALKYGKSQCQPSNATLAQICSGPTSTPAVTCSNAKCGTIVLGNEMSKECHDAQGHLGKQLYTITAVACEQPTYGGCYPCKWNTAADGKSCIKDPTPREQLKGGCILETCDPKEPIVELHWWNLSDTGSNTLSCYAKFCDASGHTSDYKKIDVSNCSILPPPT